MTSENKTDTTMIDAMMRGDECPNLGEPDFGDEPQAADVTAVRPVYMDIGNPIHETAQQTDTILGQRTREGKARIFRQNGRLVHIVGKAGRDTAGISTVTHSSLPVLVSPFVTFYEEKDTKNGPKIRDLPGCTQEFAKRFLSDAQKGKSSIPELTGICTMPTLRPDGSVVEQAGYDEASGLYLILDQEFPPVPENPSREDAREALERLFFPVSLFPFKDSAARAAYFSMLLAAVVRRALRAAPAGLIDAPTMGTGKSLLTWIIGYLATGKSVQSMTFPYTQNEQKKTIFSALLAGTAILAFDNIDVPVKGAALCTAITEEIYSDRILGVSETASAPCGAIVILNGNNVSVEADMCTRVIPCTLDAGVEDPHLRQFPLDVKEYVAEHRAQMVVDILTVIRAYLVSGERIPPASRFPDWSRFVREPLIWSGEADPMDAAADIAHRDPVRNSLGDVLETLETYYGTTPFLARDAVSPPHPHDRKQKEKYVMQEALEAAIKTSATDLTARSLGRYFDKYRGRIVNGRKLMNTQVKKDNNVLWVVENVEGTTQEKEGGAAHASVVQFPIPQDAQLHQQLKLNQQGGK